MNEADYYLYDKSGSILTTGTNRQDVVESLAKRLNCTWKVGSPNCRTQKVVDGELVNKTLEEIKTFDDRRKPKPFVPSAAQLSAWQSVKVKYPEVLELLKELGLVPLKISTSLDATRP
jgi:hypothetical protein